MRALSLAVLLLIVSSLRLPHTMPRRKPRVDQPSAAASSSCDAIVSVSSESRLVAKNNTGTSSFFDVSRKMVTNPGSRSGLARNLGMLQNAGLLSDDFSQSIGSSESSMKRTLQNVMEADSKTETPYGTVVQIMELNTVEGDTISWDYCNPLALLYHLTSICHALGDLMADLYTPGTPMRVVIYADECEPGNPLRPDIGRLMQCLYFCFVEWPPWLLTRSGAWLNLGFIRSALCKKVRGGLSGLMATMLRSFFSRNTTPSFPNGVLINTSRGHVTIDAVFAGFLADDACHTYLSSAVGASGYHICLTCKNVLNRIDEDVMGDDIVSCACTDNKKFVQHTNEGLRAIAAHLTDLHGRVSGTRLKKHQTQIGFNYSEHALLFQTDLHDVYRPVDHMIRDWMHIFVSGGIANTEVGLLLHVLVDAGILLADVTTFMCSCTLPKTYGKVQQNWIAGNKIKLDALSSFASTMLSVVPLLVCFLEMHVAPLGILSEHILCLTLLSSILGLLKLGSEKAVPHMDKLARLIRMHANLFVELYPGAAKPKFHAQFHIYENVMWLDKLLSCFVCERKHRVSKQAALFVFRNMEHTVTADVVNRLCTLMREDQTLFNRYTLVSPKNVSISGVMYRHAHKAIVDCGEVNLNDIVLMKNKSIGKVTRFWQQPSLSSDIQMQFDELPTIDRTDNRILSTTPVGTTFADVSEIVDTLTYLELGPSVIRVLMPFNSS